MALASNNPKGPITAWKHIGLYGNTIGTFRADPSAIQWKSSTSGNEDVVITKLLPGRSLISALWTVFGAKAYLRVLHKNTTDKYATQELRFDGFPPEDFEKLRTTFQKYYNVDLRKHMMSSCGSSFGNVDISGRHLVFRQSIIDEEDEGEDGDEMLSMDLGEVSQCVLPGNNRNEIELQFLESDTVETKSDQLVQVRFYVPPNQEADDSEKEDTEAATAAELFQQAVTNKANIRNTTGNVIVELDENKGTFLTPRGRYAIELYDSFLRMRGNKYDYKIKYDDISKLFLLPKSDDMYMAFVIALDRPIRQGQQVYQYLVMQTPKESSELSINLDEETLKREYNGELQPVMRGSLSNLIAKAFKVVTGKRVFIPGKFANSHQQACVKCAYRAYEGHLYPLEKQLIFIHKPPILIRFENIESIEFQRYAGGQGSTRNFDLCVKLITESTDYGTTKEFIFSGIDRNEYACLFSFLSGKKIKVINPVGSQTASTSTSANAKMYKDDMEESSDDEDYEENKEEMSSEGDGSDDSGTENDSDSDLMEVVSESDLDEEVSSKKKKEKKEVKKRPIQNISNQKKSSTSKASLPVSTSSTSAIRNKKKEKRS